MSEGRDTSVKSPTLGSSVSDDTPLESPRLGPFDAAQSQKLEGVSQIHAAAVNGDKAWLARVLMSNTGTGVIDSGDQFGRTPLMFCVLADRLECAELLLKAGAQTNQKDKGGRTALHWAAHKGNVRLLKLVLSKGADCHQKDNEGQTALHLCTRHKSPKCMTLLLRQLLPGEIDDQDRNKRTALHWAASYGNLEHVKMLIKQDSNIGIPDIEGKTPLHWAASSKDPEAVNCVKLILDTTPSVINWQDYEGRTALHLAVADGNIAVVKALVAVDNCNVSALDNMFRTPLHWAAVLGHSKIVSLLLDNHADYSSSDQNGATPLHYAAQNNFDDTVEVFLSRATVTDETDVEGRSAFMWASGKGADGVVSMFIKHNVDIQQVDKNGGTALHAAALSGHASTVKHLLDHGALIDATDFMKHTPLFRACEMGHTDVVQTLIDDGARVDMVDEDGRSPLHWAALGGHAYICQTLIKYGVDPNIKDSSGRTPIQCASYGGYVNCMSVLMEHKADPNAHDCEGMTALHWSCSKGHLDAVKLLIEYRTFPNHMEFTEDRYTPLDYALMGEHHEVAQYMLEQGALSITGIQDIAALKIQSAFRGYRVRKTFKENKRLLMKHEQLKKEAARKRATEEFRKKEDSKHRREVEDRLRKTSLLGGSAKSKTEPDKSRREHPRKSRKEAREEEEHVLRKRKQTQVVKQTENTRLHDFRRKQYAAMRIQKAWRNHKMRSFAILLTAKQAVKKMRLKQGAEEFHKQIAAVTIQLAWRKYIRRKLLQSLSPNKRQLRMWDPELVAMKQRALVSQIYGEQIDAPFWHPNMYRPQRPYWTKLAPSSAALSYNFAIDQYHPLVAKKGCLPSPFLDERGHPKEFLWQMIDEDELQGQPSSATRKKVS
ncbi:inversin-like isoform X2 [Mya arenaria]|uniref:inversin-like isoform X2 n=1 Tax=Mya arenaria TaxID=6604 RepID=UPI0022E32B97|nr:inversin-like isoform X2 [Mya arenaria]